MVASIFIEITFCVNAVKEEKKLSVNKIKGAS
jgi:hypothetical protein